MVAQAGLVQFDRFAVTKKFTRKISELQYIAEDVNLRNAFVTVRMKKNSALWLKQIFTSRYNVESKLFLQMISWPLNNKLLLPHLICSHNQEDKQNKK